MLQSITGEITFYGIDSQKNKWSANNYADI